MGVDVASPMERESDKWIGNGNLKDGATLVSNIGWGLKWWSHI